MVDTGKYQPRAAMISIAMATDEAVEAMMTIAVCSGQRYEFYKSAIVKAKA